MNKHVKPWLFGSVLLAILGLLFWFTRTEGNARHLHLVGRLRDIQQTDAILNQDILKASAGTLGNYDSLNQGVARLHELERSLQSDAADYEPGTRGELQVALAHLAATLDEKDHLIEEFASRNAVLKNSVNYLPIAATNITEMAETGEGQQRSRKVRGVIAECPVIHPEWKYQSDDASGDAGQRPSRDCRGVSAGSPAPSESAGRPRPHDYQAER